MWSGGIGSSGSRKGGRVAGQRLEYFGDRTLVERRSCTLDVGAGDSLRDILLADVARLEQLVPQLLRQFDRWTVFSNVLLDEHRIERDTELFVALRRD